MSLQRRLMLTFSLAFTLMWLAAASLTGLRMEHEVGEIYDSALQDLAERILPLAYAELLSGESNPGQHIAPLNRRHEWISYVVRDAASHNLLQSGDEEVSQIPKGLARGFSSSDHFRLFTEVGVSGTISVTTAENLDQRTQAVRHALGPLLWPLLALIPATLLAVWAAVSLAFGPVRRFAGAIAAQDRGNLKPVAGADLPKELQPLATAVNGLIHRLKNALEAEQAFTANSAHELRTPIAAALAQTQRLVAELNEDAPRQRAQAVASALRRLARLSEKLLQLAKAEGGGLIATSLTPLAPVLRLVLDEITRSLDPEQPFVVDITEVAHSVDPDAFAILARNLIENAVRHGASEGEIHITLSKDAFSVANEGAFIPPQHLDRLTRRFQRGTSNAEGTGLGLAIVSAICRGAGLNLTMASPAPGCEGGLAVTVTFATPAPQA